MELPHNMTYGDIYHQMEVEFSHYNFKEARVPILEQSFSKAVSESYHLLDKNLPLPAYDQCLHASHLFNVLDARGTLSVAIRYIAEVRGLAKACFKAWNCFYKIKQRERVNERAFIQGLLGKIPFLLQEKAAARWRVLTESLLKEMSLSFTEAWVYVTPRRLVLQVTDMPSIQPRQLITKRGPRVGCPEAELEGFFEVLRGFTARLYLHPNV